MKIRTKYDTSVRQVHPKCGKTMTEQHHAKTCNINSIIAKYQKTGLIEHTNRHQATYGDVSGADFKDAMDLIAEQKTVFQELPATVRKHYDNDPANYLEATQTEEGQQIHHNLLNPQPEIDQEDEKPEETPPVEAPAEETAVT